MEAALLTKIATGISAVGSVIGTIGSMQAASYQSAIAERNAQIMEENSRKEILRSQTEVQDQAEAARAQIGQLIAAQGASGISLNTGSALRRRDDLTRLASRDALRTREDAEVRAQNLRQGAADFRGEAGQARRRRTFSIFSGVANVGSSLIGGAQQLKRIQGLQA